MSDVLRLEDIINVEAFQKIQDDIADATGLAIITTDYKGKPVTKHSRTTDFCSIIRKNSKLQELCEKCDSRGGLEAVRTGKPFTYRCHTGLIDFAVPIIVQGQYLGSLMAGQILTEESKLKDLESIIQNNNDCIKASKELQEKYKDIRTIPFSKIQSIAQMMFHISNYIVDEGVLKIAQQKLNEENIKLMETKKVQIEIEKELKATQLKALQSQINPHFLFNVLNSISALALIENAQKTQEVICDLSGILRYTLKKGNEKVEVQEAINYVNSYLKLQKVRFGSRLEFYIDVKEECKKIKIPFMIIQPFVENSIIHGLELKEKGGTVKINIYKSDRFLIIHIIDNGRGIEKHKLELINAGKEEEYTRNSLSGIGISNIKQRMSYYYGEDYSIDISSKINSGTQVKIILPE